MDKGRGSREAAQPEGTSSSSTVQHCLGPEVDIGNAKINKTWPLCLHRSPGLPGRVSWSDSHRHRVLESNMVATGTVKIRNEPMEKEGDSQYFILEG